MQQFREGLGDAWSSVAGFLPVLLGALLILLVGYVVAKALEKAVDKVLERVGFDRWVERGGIKRALETFLVEGVSKEMLWVFVEELPDPEIFLGQ